MEWIIRIDAASFATWACSYGFLSIFLENSRIGIIVFALSLPISAALFYSFLDSRFVFCAILSALIIVRHQANIKRMLMETRIGLNLK